MNITEKQFDELRVKWPKATLIDRHTAYVQIKDFPLPEGFNKTKTTLVFEIPFGYPMSSPDSFFIGSDVRKTSGSNLPLTSFQRAPNGETLIYISCHPAHWYPNQHSLKTWVQTINKMLEALPFQNETD